MKEAREKILRERLEMAQHNRRCYTGKKAFEKELEETIAEEKVLLDWLDEFHSEPELMQFQVWEWFVDETEDSEYDRNIDVILAVSEYHAIAQLKYGINSGKYQKGNWLEHYVEGEKIMLDTKGRVAA